MNKKLSLPSCFIKKQTILLHIIFIITTTLAFIYFASFGYYNHAITDPFPEIQAPQPTPISERSNTTAFVETGLFIQNFSTFEPEKNNFCVEAILWFAFDPNKVSLDIINKFSFEKGSIKKKSDPEISVVGHKILARYYIELEFSTDLSFLSFPFADHRINLMLYNKYVSPSEVLYRSKLSSFQLSKHARISGWERLTQQITYGNTFSQLDKEVSGFYTESPMLIFSTEYTREGIRKIILIFGPIIIMFFVALFALCLNPETHGSAIFPLATGGLAAVLSYRFVIEVVSPPVGYFTFTDYFYTYILFALFIVFLFAAYSIRSKKISEWFYCARTITLCLLHFGFIGLSFYVFKIIM